MTALAFSRKAALPLALPAEPFYRHALAIGHIHGVVDPNGLRSIYDFSAAAKAETVLVAAASAAGSRAEPSAMVAALRASGLSACLTNLIELAEVGEPEHLAECAFTIDADGRALWCFVARRDREGVEVDGVTFGGSPKGRTFTLDGRALANALAP